MVIQRLNTIQKSTNYLNTGATIGGGGGGGGGGSCGSDKVLPPKSPNSFSATARRVYKLRARILNKEIYTVFPLISAPGTYLIFKVSGAVLIGGRHLFQKLENELKTLHTNWIFFRINS